jgi:predicted acylesterase/phospholipase RssA
MEPFRYQGHIYADGGMVNDFPIDCLPDDGHRLGVMIRSTPWWAYNLGLGHKGGADAAVGREALDRAPAVREWLESRSNFLGGHESRSIYPTRDAVELGITWYAQMLLTVVLCCFVDPFTTC